MNIVEIGKNAGLVWKTLHQKGSQTSSSLKKLTGLDDKNLCLALGWLAREGNKFPLRETKHHDRPKIGLVSFPAILINVFFTLGKA
jgi:hypothetical protein